MRISDWSSDVCSSDLGSQPGCAPSCCSSAPPIRPAPPAAGLRPPAARPPARRTAARASNAGSGLAAAGSARPSRAVLYVLHLYDHYVLYGPASESEESRPARVSALLRIPKTGAQIGRAHV